MAKTRYWLPALASLAVAYLIYVWDRLVVAIELVEIRRAFDLQLSSAGLLATVFTLGITVGAIPAGFIAARIGARRSLVLGLLVFSACTAWSAFSSSFTSMLISRIAGGVGEALFNVALYAFLSSHTERFKGAAAGFPATVFGVGIFSAPLVITALLEATAHWKGPFLVLAGAGFVIAGAIWIFVAELDAPTKSTQKADLSRLRAILSANGALFILVAINGIAIYSFIALFHTFLRDDQGLTLDGASRIVSLFGIGQLCGGIPMGYFADRIGRRIYIPAAALMVGVVGIGVFAEMSPVSYAALAFLFGIGTNSIYTNCIAMAQENVEPSEISIVTGLLASMYFLTASFSGWLLAVLKDILGWQHAGVVLYAIPFVLFAAASWWFWSQPRQKIAA